MLFALGAPPIAAQTGRFHLAVVPNLSSADLSVIDTRSNRETARVPIGERPWRVAMSPDGRFAWVTSGPVGRADRISAVDLNSLQVVNSIVLTPAPGLYELEVSPDGRTLAAGGVNRGDMILLDAATLTILRRVALCGGCGTNLALISTPTFTFSSDARYLYAAVPAENSLVTYDLTTLGEVARTPGLLPYPDSTEFPDIRAFAGAPHWIVSSKHGVQVSASFGTVNVPIEVRSFYPHDLLPIEIGGELFVMYGSFAYPASGRNVVRLRHLNTGAVLELPSSASPRHLRFDPTRLQVWSVCPSLVAACSPSRIDVFDLLTQQTTTISGLVQTRAGTGELSQDYRFYYQVWADQDLVHVVDVATRTTVTAIVVGDNPRAIMMQGDARTRSSW